MFDEFQEIVTLKDALQIEAVMRSQIQQQQASFFFVGSRRRVLLGIFNEQQRPFFRGAINYPIDVLPDDELIDFVKTQFKSSNKECSNEIAKKIISTAQRHPYYVQKLCFFVFEDGDRHLKEANITSGMEKLLYSERPVFEAMMQGLTRQQCLLLYALTKEPTDKALASSYIQKHNIGSVGGIQHSLKQLEDIDLIERDKQTKQWKCTDSLFAVWVKGRTEEKIL